MWHQSIQGRHLSFSNLRSLTSCFMYELGRSSDYTQRCQIPSSTSNPRFASIFYIHDKKEKKNTEILKELKVGQDWLLNNIKARILSYFGHLKRHDSLERHILEARLEGKRRKGRPTRRWTEDI